MWRTTRANREETIKEDRKLMGGNEPPKRVNGTRLKKLQLIDTEREMWSEEEGEGGRR